MSDLQFVTTADGSKTIFSPSIGENYHSKHGALQESKHVFLKSGLEFFLEHNDQKTISILEVGFGTGLNFLLSAEYCTANHITLSYTGIEAYPLGADMISQTGYNEYVDQKLYQTFVDAYAGGIEDTIQLNDFCRLKIDHCKLDQFTSEQQFDILYFDAFAAIHQPEMWSHESLEHCCQFLHTGAVFVTYAITGNLKRTMRALGFEIEKAPGAPGKREMLRAIKI